MATNHKCRQCGDQTTGRRRYCSRLCAHAGRFGTPASRFWQKVEKTESCWLWRSSMRNGYGILRTPHGQSHKVFYAHRFVWELTYGPIPDGLCVCHHCDVQLCVRPDHLFLGTIADNNRDMLEKGRGRASENSRNRGERNPWAKLQADDVRAIREARVSGATHAAIARQFNVSIHTIVAILRGRNWSHVV